MKPPLTIEHLLGESAAFSATESAHDEPALFGVTDGKAVGTYFEHKFTSLLAGKYSFDVGNSALGIDIPSLEVDVKVTSAKQPQSSCPYQSARQKIYGLGYGLLLFVYEKTDHSTTQSSRLTVRHTIYIDKEYTGDYQTTRGIREMIERDANADDLIAFIHERNLPVDEIGATEIARELLGKKPEQGYLTISNALQWRLQYQRVIQMAGELPGIRRVT
jgi:hypothetical protein